MTERETLKLIDDLYNEVEATREMLNGNPEFYQKNSFLYDVLRINIKSKRELIFELYKQVIRNSKELTQGVKIGLLDFIEQFNMFGGIPLMELTYTKLDRYFIIDLKTDIGNYYVKVNYKGEDIDYKSEKESKLDEYLI